jgi:hypothetical protein
VPPVTLVTVALPFALPQVAAVVAVMAVIGPLTTPILNTAVKVQLLASFTITVWLPAGKLPTMLDVATPFTEYVYAGVPPVTPVTENPPVAPTHAVGEVV